jgi:MOSC domain-containing protein YiiM
MAFLHSVNIGAALAVDYADAGTTGIDKRPVLESIEVRDPGTAEGGSGLVGDEVCDRRRHGGTDQAVYAFAMEDLRDWSAELGRDVPPGLFGENLTTAGLAVTDALIGERWQVGDQVVLEVSAPRIPCRTFAATMDLPGWVKTFTAKAVPGAYLRVLRPGLVRAGDEITVLDRPDHDVTIGMTFRALTLEPELLPRLLVADALPENVKRRARERTPIRSDA